LSGQGSNEGRPKLEGKERSGGAQPCVEPEKGAVAVSPDGAYGCEGKKKTFSRTRGPQKDSIRKKREVPFFGLTRLKIKSPDVGSRKGGKYL